MKTLRKMIALAWCIALASTVNAQVSQVVYAPNGLSGEELQLRPLNEVNAFIQENKHLPEIQSAADMQENGVSMSDFQIQLLQKIEELTLYIIQQDQQIQELK